MALAQALIHDPEVLVLDEPTVGLDPKQVTEARALIKSLRSERTVIYSTHILSEVAATCDRIVIIDKGDIVAQEAINAMGVTGDCTRTEIVVQRMSDEVEQLLKGVRGVKNVQTFQERGPEVLCQSEPREDVMAEMARVVVNQNAGLIRMSPVQLALEEYYLNLIGGKREIVS